jgi:hypothetical protein
MRLAVFIPNLQDGTSFYRGQGWTSEIHKIDDSIRVEYITQPDIIKLKGADALFIQRPDNAQELRLVKTCKKLNIPVIVDYDDYLLGVQDYNRYHIIMDLAQNDYKKNVIECLKLADLVFVSTEELKRQFETYNKNIHTVRNAFDNYLYREVKGFNKDKVVLWRGSSTHKIDLGMYAPELATLIKDNSDFKFIFLSDRFFDWQIAIKEHTKNCELIQAVPVFEYWYKLLELKASIFYVCLEDSMFNKCKSDVANIEGLASGAMTIAPNWEEWKETSTHRYNTKEEFVSKFNKALNQVRDNTQPEKPKLRLLSEANKVRAELIKGLVNAKA